jgi:hypothetical protein
VQELKEQCSILRNSIEKLKTLESLRAALISHLKEALNKHVCNVFYIVFVGCFFQCFIMVNFFQDVKVAQIKNQLQVFPYAQHCLFFWSNVYLCVCVLHLHLARHLNLAMLGKATISYITYPF